MAQGLGVWPMCKWTEDTQIPLSDEHPRRIKNTYTKLNELRLRSLSINLETSSPTVGENPPQEVWGTPPESASGMWG